MAIIGDQFDECRNVDEGDNGSVTAAGAVAGSWEDGSDAGTEWPEICGCTISVRQSEDIVSLWNRVEGDPKVREKIRDTLRKVLNLPSSTILEYKSNNDSMAVADRRNTAVDRTQLS